MKVEYFYLLIIAFVTFFLIIAFELKKLNGIVIDTKIRVMDMQTIIKSTGYEGQALR